MKEKKNDFVSITNLHGLRFQQWQEPPSEINYQAAILQHLGKTTYVTMSLFFVFLRNPVKSTSVEISIVDSSWGSLLYCIFSCHLTAGIWKSH